MHRPIIATLAVSLLVVAAALATSGCGRSQHNATQGQRLGQAQGPGMTPEQAMKLHALNDELRTRQRTTQIDR